MLNLGSLRFAGNLAFEMTVAYRIVGYIPYMRPFYEKVVALRRGGGVWY